MTKKFRVIAGMPRLHRGASESPEDGACIMQYISLVKTNGFTDAPRCTTAPVRSLAIDVNDYSKDELREDRLMPLVHRIMNANGITSAQRKKLWRWNQKASEERQAELGAFAARYPKPNVGHYCDGVSCSSVKNCRMAAWITEARDIEAQVAYKWLLKMLDQIEAWKHKNVREATPEEWLELDQHRLARVKA